MSEETNTTQTETTKKYEFTGETKQVGNKTLHRIRLIKQIDLGVNWYGNYVNIPAGTVGGWIEDERNLSHEGKCFVHDEAIVMDFAKVDKDASVKGHAIVRDYATVTDKATVEDEAAVTGYAAVSNTAVVSGRSAVSDYGTVRDNAKLAGSARVKDMAKICGNAKMCENAELSDCAELLGVAVMHDNSKVCNRATVKGATKLHDSAWVGEEAVTRGNDLQISGNASVRGRAVVEGGDIRGEAVIAGDSHLYGKPQISGAAYIGGHAAVGDDDGYFTMSVPAHTGFNLTYIPSTDTWYDTFGNSYKSVNAIREAFRLEAGIVDELFSAVKRHYCKKRGSQDA